MNGLNGESVYGLCNEKQYFTCGCTMAYNRMFDLVRQGVSRETLAAVIWSNSDEDADLEQIVAELEQIAGVR